MDHANRYINFESLLIDNAELSFQDYNLGGIDNITLEDNSIIDLAQNLYLF